MDGRTCTGAAGVERGGGGAGWWWTKQHCDEELISRRFGRRFACRYNGEGDVMPLNLFTIIALIWLSCEIYIAYISKVLYEFCLTSFCRHSTRSSCCVKGKRWEIFIEKS